MAQNPIGAASHFQREPMLDQGDHDSGRHEALEANEALWKGLEYEHLSHDWTGAPLVATSSTSAFTETPFHLRKPDAPSRLGGTVVNRFTGLLLSTSTRPRIRCLGDPMTEDWISGVMSEEIWAAFAESRGYGGGMGTAVVSLAIHDGTVVFEIHNPRHCIPSWQDRLRLIPSALTIQYEYVRRERNRFGALENVRYLYRRQIGQSADTIYQPWPTAKGTPQWTVLREVPHGFSACPVAWIQNVKCSEQIDGLTDFCGQEPAIKAYDRQISHALRGTALNCDPTLYIATKKQQSGAIRKGSDNALILDQGDATGYLEISGAGSTSARDNAAVLKSNILEACSVVLEREAAVEQTATEANYRHRAMFARVDLLRGQYGAGLLRLVTLLVERAKSAKTTFRPVAQPTIEADEDGEAPPGGTPAVTERDVILVPPRVVDDPENPDTPAKLIPREVGPGGVLVLQWPEHQMPSPQDVSLSGQSLADSVTRGWIDSETAARMWSAKAGVPNPVEAFRKGQREKGERDEAVSAKDTQLTERMLQGLEKSDAKMPPKPEPEEPDDPKEEAD